MNEEFVPYEESLTLKELGFDNPCFGFYTSKREIRRYTNFDGEINDFQTLKNSSITMGDDWCTVPTFSQAFRFFRKKHNLRTFVDTRVCNVNSPYQWVYDYQIKMGNGIDVQPYFSGDFDTYEEAELACLRKLIEFIKKNHESSIR